MAVEGVHCVEADHQQPPESDVVVVGPPDVVAVAADVVEQGGE